MANQASTDWDRCVIKTGTACKNKVDEVQPRPNIQVRVSTGWLRQAQSPQPPQPPGVLQEPFQIR